jgi:hypothetical protein
MAFDNRVQLKSYIRFQLSQLSARNAAHEFENLVYELARLRVASNLRPATGPVQAGGDQGRDFEGFRTYLAKSSLATSAFVGRAHGGLIAGACTLEQAIAHKVKNDLEAIFGSGTRPTHVAYFCERDLPVGSRHTLEAFCRDTYGAALDIFDGQAIADLLADRDTFWIAEQYLSLPTDAWPKEPVDQHYESLRARWVAQTRQPLNYSDFLELKQGLRTATFEDEARPDLPAWLKIMGSFVDGSSGERLSQKARYEVAVAELRGRGSLNPALSEVQTFFTSLSPDSSPAELLDPSVLCVYARGAEAHRHTSAPVETIAEWGAQGRRSSARCAPT